MSGVTTNLLGKRADDYYTVEKSGKIFRQNGAPLSTLGHVGNWAIDVSVSPANLWHKVEPWPPAQRGVFQWQFTPHGALADGPLESFATVSQNANAWTVVGVMPVPPDPSYFALKWYSDARMQDNIGNVGDYALFTGREAHPLVWGPKDAYGWPENGNGPYDVLTLPLVAYTPEGLTGSGSPVSVNTTTLQTSNVSGTAAILSTITVTTTTNQQAPYWLRGVLGDIASVLGINLAAIKMNGLETWGHAFTGTFGAPATI